MSETPESSVRSLPAPLTGGSTDMPVPTSVPAPMESNSILITNHKLTGQNYLSWSKTVEMFIIGRGKDDYLYGSLQSLASTDPGFRQ